MSLARTLMSGGSFGSTIDPAKYSHDMGASRIAMETVEELHEIFIESFYNVEQAELAAATEGVDLIGSDYEVVAEGAIKTAFTKVKEFLQKLWDKVKAWFHQVRRYLDSIFMSGKKFAEKYKEDIKEADRNLKDFSYRMYEYEDDKLDSVDKYADTDDVASEIFKGIEKISKARTDIEDIKKDFEEDALAKRFASRVLSGGKVAVTEKADLPSAAFAYFRNGAKSADDKTEVKITNLSTYGDKLRTSKALGSIDSLTSRVGNMYKKAISKANELEKVNQEIYDEADDKDTTKKEEADYKVKAAQEMSSAIGRLQSMHNTVMGIWKTALKERDTVYKQVIMAGLANARKNAKNK